MRNKEQEEIRRLPTNLNKGPRACGGAAFVHAPLQVAAGSDWPGTNLASRPALSSPAPAPSLAATSLPFSFVFDSIVKFAANQRASELRPNNSNGDAVNDLERMKRVRVCT